MALYIKQNNFKKHAASSALSYSSQWIIHLSLLSLVAIIAIVFKNEVLCQIIVFVYALLLALLGIKSEEIFKIAMVTFAVVIIGVLINSDVISRYFAIYAFLLIAVGVGKALYDEWRPGVAATMRFQGQRRHAFYKQTPQLFTARRRNNLKK